MVRTIQQSAAGAVWQTSSRLLYSLLIYLLRPLLLLFFLWRSRADKGYRQRWHERFAWQTIPAQARGGILLHAVSMGEVIAAAPLIRRLLTDYPQLPLTVTCTTPTGSAQLRRLFGEQVYHWYLPLDTPFACRRFLRKLAPQQLLVMETELWPNLLTEAHRQGVLSMLVNARLSARSARGYCKVLPLLGPLLNRFSAILTVDEASRRRFAVLCAARVETPQQLPVQLLCSGNLKFDLTIPPDLAGRAARLRAQWGARPIWVAGSTHAGEDEQVIAAHQQLLSQQPDVLLILVPRHPDRFAQVAALLADSGLCYQQRSQQQARQDDAIAARTQVLLGDSMGELLLWYQLADQVFIGGSLIERGGHNPLEAMCLEKPLLSGRHVFNFHEIYQQLSAKQALLWVADARTLAQALQQLWQQPDKARQMASAGLALFNRQGGALARTLQVLAAQPLAVPKVQPAGLDWLNPALAARVPAEWARPAFWQQAQAVVGHSSGRHTVYFVNAAVAAGGEPGQQSGAVHWVLRHYYRGGLVGKLNRDWFWPVPVARSRAMAEFQLLLWMAAQGLPVPVPVAARYQRRGWFGYSADILLERVAGSEDLFQYLQRQPLPAAQWQQLGQLIARLQQAGVYHSDLNCHNILICGGEDFVLIDFDKCWRRAGTDWQQQPLLRLRRSFAKEQQKARARHQSFYFSDHDFAQLLLGYQQQSAIPSV